MIRAPRRSYANRPSISFHRLPELLRVLAMTPPSIISFRAQRADTISSQSTLIFLAPRYKLFREPNDCGTPSLENFKANRPFFSFLKFRFPLLRLLGQLLTALKINLVQQSTYIIFTKSVDTPFSTTQVDISCEYGHGICLSKHPQ